MWSSKPAGAHLNEGEHTQWDEEARGEAHLVHSCPTTFEAHIGEQVVGTVGAVRLEEAHAGEAVVLEQRANKTYKIKLVN